MKEAQKEFMRAVEAYEILSNPKEREIYDALGEDNTGATRPSRQQEDIHGSAKWFRDHPSDWYIS